MNRTARGLTLGVAVVVAVSALGAAGYALVDDDPAATNAAAQADLPPGAQAVRPAPAPDRLLPNMRSLAPSDLQIETPRDGTRLLRFAGSLANAGDGPLLLKPREDPSCTSGRRAADQLLHQDRDGNGVFDRGVDTVIDALPAGCMPFHPGHDHWHFEAMASYTLRAPGAATPTAFRDKVSFCLRDNVRVPGAPRVVKKEHFGECSKNTVQGISPGWVDVYKADLDGQTLPLPAALPAGPLCLEVVADPLNRMVESAEDDNAAAIAIEIDGDRVRQVQSAVCG